MNGDWTANFFVLKFLKKKWLKKKNYSINPYNFLPSLISVI